MTRGKKGAMLRDTIVGFSILLVFAGIMFVIIPGPLKAFAGQADSNLIKAHNRECSGGDLFDQLRGSEDAYDEDVPGGDGMPDYCDICLGGDTIDSDRDGMPDACDEKEGDPGKRKCKKGIRRKNIEEKFYCCVEDIPYTISEDPRKEVICES